MAFNAVFERVHIVPQMCFTNIYHKWLMANPFLRDSKVHSRGGDHEGEEEEVGESGPQDPQMDRLAQLPHLKGLRQGSLNVF